jgi:deoxyinosine 3'endonuclease (endonuclease V)
MAEPNSLRQLREKELITLRERVERRIKLKPGPKRIRRVAGIDIVLTPEAFKVHVCTCLTSFPKLQVLEEAIATDELDDAARRRLGNITLVPLVLSVLKMLKHNPDVVMIRELSLREEIPFASYVGVISGKPCVGISERPSSFKAISKWEGVKRAGNVKIRGHKTPLGVIAGHLMTLKDAAALARASAKETRMPEPVRGAGLRVRAWEREWRRVNLERR